jgi:hypothetical protein
MRFKTTTIVMLTEQNQENGFFLKNVGQREREREGEKLT